QNHHRNQHRIKAQSQNTAPETPSASEIVTRALEEPVVKDDADEVTPSPVPEFEMPDASPTPLKRPHPTPDVQDTQIKPSPSPEPTPVTLSVPSESGSLCALIHYVLHEKIQSCVCASPMSSCLNVSSISQQRDEVIKDCRRLSKWVYIMMQKEIHVD